MANIDDIEKLVRDYANRYPQSQAVFDRPLYEKALQKYGPEVTAKMIDQLYHQLVEEFAQNAKIYDKYAAENGCRRHPQGGCVCNKTA